MMKPQAEHSIGSCVPARLSQSNAGPQLHRLSKALMLAGCAFLLTACEAPLNLSGVEQELDKSIRRTDQILSLALTDRVQVAVGSSGLVLTRTDANTAWQRLTLDGAPNLIDVNSCPDGTFIALSFERQLWISDADARQWRKSDLPTPENLLDATCAPDGSYWAVGSFSTLMVSHDQGENWTESSLNEDAMLTSIQFLNDSTAYATGEFGLVVRSDDAGQTWLPLEYIPNDFYPQAAYFRTREQGWVVGLDGMVMHTADAGESWQAESTPIAAPLYGITDTSAGLFALGENGTLLSRTAERWELVAAPLMPVWLRSGAEQSSGELLVAGGNGTLVSLPIQQ